MPDSSITKRALADAIKYLMADKPLKKISVGDICEHCNMNRKSFYYHFKDKFDLVNWVFYTEFVEQLISGDYADAWSFMERICVYFHENRAFYVNALELEGQNSFSEYFAETMRPLITIHYIGLLDDDDARDFFTIFYTDAFLAAIKRWLGEGTIPPTQFAQLVRRATNHSKNR